jgi:uncharacterized membrane protein
MQTLTGGESTASWSEAHDVSADGTIVVGSGQLGPRS